jgi:hypothetical protein
MTSSVLRFLLILWRVPFIFEPTIVIVIAIVIVITLIWLIHYIYYIFK